ASMSARRRRSWTERSRRSRRRSEAMAFVTPLGARLYWREGGAGGKPALLLLHAIGTDLALWDPGVAGRGRSFRLFRVDSRGHGASDATAGDYDLATLARDAFAVLDAAGAARAAVCGLSLGGMVAMKMACVAPDRVTALVAACTSPAMDPDTWEARRRT